LPLDLVLADVVASMDGADSADDACHRAVAALARHTPAMIAVLLHVEEHLHCVAAAGSWQVYSSIPQDRGVSGRVLATGRTATVTDVAHDPDYLPLGPPVRVEICAPVPGPAGVPAGALNVEWSEPVEIDNWRPTIEEVAQRIGDRVTALGGPPAESKAEKLLRHALGFSTASDEQELLARSLVAAGEVSGLGTPVVLLPGRSGARARLDERRPTRLGHRLAAVPSQELERIMAYARGPGASYTLGDPAHFDTHGFEVLTGIGVRSMITVPVGPGPEPGPVLLVVDERAGRPDPAVISLLELLAAHAWTSLDRLRTLRRLAEKANSDPLTGLRHYGPFGERLASSTPGRTALLTIDIDRFKELNDTYGHQAGDRALVNLAQTLQSTLRGGDELYRIGGDEFAAVVDVPRVDEALVIAERLVEAARRIGRPISVGVAIQAVAESPEDTLRRADQAMYDAKRTGRDGVRVAPLRRIADVA
jgi:diguanylate cyclase (GGDEF)-like protein